MVAQKYRWDFIGLSTDTKPTAETSEKVVNGSTYYCSDTSKLYVYCDGTWYERQPLGGGGGGGSYTAGTGIDITNDTISLDSTSQASLAKADTAIQNTDYASSSVAGVLKVSNGVVVGNTGYVSCTPRTYADYTGLSSSYFISKGTLENVLAERGGGGAITELTTDDYDTTVSSTQGIGLWKLPAGLYHTANDVQAFAGNDSGLMLSLSSHLIIIDDDGNNKLIKVIGDNLSTQTNGVYKGFIQYSVKATTGAGSLSANTISVVTSHNLLTKRAEAPSSSDVSFRGALRYDNSTNKLYINVNGPGDYSGNWKEIQLVS